MWWRSVGFGGGGGGGGGAGGPTTAFTLVVRHFSRAAAQNLRKINPRVSPQEASSIAQDLYHLIKQRGPVSISNAWIQAKEACVSGLTSKTHLKLMLKWMRGRKMLKQSCNQVGSSKKFLLCTLPEDPHTEQPEASPKLKVRSKKKPALKKRKAK